MQWPETLSQTMNRLEGRGTLPILDNDLESFRIDAVYRFEGPTDPGDEMIRHILPQTQPEGSAHQCLRHVCGCGHGPH